MNSTRVLVLGVTGMLGYEVFKVVSSRFPGEVRGVCRSIDGKEAFFNADDDLVLAPDASCDDAYEDAIAEFLPHVVINCVGVIKQKEQGVSPSLYKRINADLPHELTRQCDQVGARLIHFSTDCVFAGTQGGYSEFSPPDATDLYATTKLAGEVLKKPHLTLRTSIIGHELSGSNSLIDWFLNSAGGVDGYANAVFSGLPTVIIGDIVGEIIQRKNKLWGLYHLSAKPINKYDLLTKVSKIYKVSKVIEPVSEPKIDRSLDSQRFWSAVDSVPPGWDDLIESMYLDYKKLFETVRRG